MSEKNKTEEEISNILDAPIHESAIKFKVQSLSRDKKKALLVCYADARVVQNRLDDAFGKFGWQNKVRALEVPVVKPDYIALKEMFVGYDGKTDMRKLKEFYLGYFKQKFIHSLGIWCADKNQWIWHEDGADDTDVASIKGGISVSFRRVAVHTGVARSFYDLDDLWVDISTTKKAGQESFYRSGDTYYYNKPKLPGWAAEKEPEKAPVTVEVAGFKGTYTEILAQMKKDKRYLDGITPNESPLPDAIEAAEKSGNYTDQQIVEKLVKYFGGE